MYEVENFFKFIPIYYTKFDLTNEKYIDILQCNFLHYLIDLFDRKAYTTMFLLCREIDLLKFVRNR